MSDLDWVFEPNHQKFVEEILERAPDSWDGEESADYIAVAYVRALEARVVGLGGSLDKWAEPLDSRIDVVIPDSVIPEGEHRYWSTHCRHDAHDACAATELAPGVPRRPAQCKTCGSPCICSCHAPGGIGQNLT